MILNIKFRQILSTLRVRVSIDIEKRKKEVTEVCWFEKKTQDGESLCFIGLSNNFVFIN